MPSSGAAAAWHGRPRKPALRRRTQRNAQRAGAWLRGGAGAGGSGRQAAGENSALALLGRDTRNHAYCSSTAVACSYRVLCVDSNVWCKRLVVRVAGTASGNSVRKNRHLVFFVKHGGRCIAATSARRRTAPRWRRRATIHYATAAHRWLSGMRYITGVARDAHRCGEYHICASRLRDERPIASR